MWTIGRLADTVGVSVRSLRHYDTIGLVPATRSPSGHRRYRPEDAARVRRVIVLRLVGLSLTEISEVVDGDEKLLGALVRARRRELDTRLAELQLTRRQLRGAEYASGDSILNTLEDIMTGSTFTPAQLQQLKARHSDTSLMAWMTRARELDTTVRGLLDADASPTGAAAQEAARQWQRLLAEMASHDPVIEAAIVAKLDRRGAGAATRGAISEEAWYYLRLAIP